MKFTVSNLPSSMFLLVFFIALVSHTHGSKIDHHRSNKHVPLFIFGDSFLDAGNNNYINTTTLDQANFLPYGETYFKFPTGRFSDGRLISDFIAEYANLPLVPPYLQPGNSNYYGGVNFASGGAGALVETFQGSVIPFKTQARNYEKVGALLRHKLGSSEAKLLLSSAVYMFSIGSNDYLSPFLTHSDVLNSYSHSEYVGMVVANMTSIIKEIYKRGARKFVFMTLPPLGCLPGTRIIQLQGNGKCLQELSALASLHNGVLKVVLLQLDKQLKGFKFALYDFSADLTQMINHPLKYGLKEGKSACCGSGPFRGVYSCGGKRGEKQFELCDKPNEYLFWDSYHLTESAYKKFADQEEERKCDELWYRGVKLKVIDLKAQAKYFTEVSKQFKQKLGDLEAKKLLSRAINIFSIEGNDYGTPFLTDSTSESAAEHFAKLMWSGNRDVTVTEYAELPLIPPYLHPGYHDHQYIYGVNFASSGAGDLPETNPGLVIDLKTQALYFAQVGKLLRKILGEEKAKKLLSTAVYIFSVGTNDYAVPFYTNSNGTVGIYNEGGRKFGFVNVAPLNRSPFLRTFVNGTTIDACLKEQGSKEGNVACCGGGPYMGDYSCGGKREIEEYELCNNVDEYVFFDSPHPTESTAEHFAQLMWNGNKDVIDFYNLKQLFHVESIS
ncbi:GDSL esterase/lipase 5 [Glycine soja]